MLTSRPPYSDVCTYMYAGCRSLLATHFHTLADFANKFPSVGAYKLVARRSSSGLEFTYQIQVGQACRSIHTCTHTSI